MIRYDFYKLSNLPHDTTLFDVAAIKYEVINTFLSEVLNLTGSLLRLIVFNPFVL